MTINEQLKRLRIQAGMTVRGVAEALSMPSSTYAAYEDPKKFKKPILPFDLAKRLAALFAPDVPEHETMALAGLSSMPLPRQTSQHVITVMGEIEAGVWRPETEWPASERYEIEVGPPPYPGAERFGARMRGHSMDKTIPPGSDLELLRVKFGVIDPLPGDLVVVARNRHDLTEMTCKRLHKENDQWVLRCESTRPEFQEPIYLGRADAEIVTDDETEIVAIVLSAQQRHFRRR